MYIYLADARLGKYPSLATSTSVNSLLISRKTVRRLLCEYKFLAVHVSHNKGFVFKDEIQLGEHCAYSYKPPLLLARLAQSVEHETLNPRVVGSSPTLGASLFCDLFQNTLCLYTLALNFFFKILVGVKVFFRTFL